MISKLPIINSPISFEELHFAATHIRDEFIAEEFSFALSQLFQLKYAYLTNSGISSFYAVLKTLQETSNKKEVILPAYTAGSLLVAVKKAGLIPVLCDISLKDFNLDADKLLGAVSQDTLAIVCVHMFGIPMREIASIKEKIPPGVFVIEDCAQSMGSKIKGRLTGKFGDVSFLSFNRGKNLTMYGGGCVLTNEGDLADKIQRNVRKLSAERGTFDTVEILLKVVAFSFAVSPLVYGLGYPIIYRFKETAPPEDFKVMRLTNFQAGLGLLLLKKMDDFFAKRHKNGMYIINKLKEKSELILPEIMIEDYPVFNRLPILFRDPQKRKAAERHLWASGIETSRMYEVPLHKMFLLDYKADDFPAANRLAECLLTLPVHPLVKEADLSKMVFVIEKSLSE